MGKRVSIEVCESAEVQVALLLSFQAQADKLFDDNVFISSVRVIEESALYAFYKLSTSACL